MGVLAGRSGRVPAHGRQQTLRSQIFRYRYFYLFISPFYILFLIFGVFPVAFSFYLSLQHWDAIAPMQSAGLSNYLDVLRDSTFLQSVGNTFYIGVASTVATLAAAVVIAYILSLQLVPFHNGFRTIYFLPLVTSSVAVSMIFFTIFAPNSGIVNALLRALSGHRASIDWLRTTEWIKPIIVLLIFWRWLGWNIVLYLAGLQSIPPELYDAAKVDGATVGQTLLHVTLPLLRPVILFTVVLSTIGSLQSFDESFMLTQGSGGLGNSGMTMALYLYVNAFKWGRFGYAAAISYVMFMLIVVLSVSNFRMLGRQRT